MIDPVSSYRIQFNTGFKLKDLEAIIPYLNRLGIKSVYASPIFEAVPGSMHGYDGVNPNRINPEIGTIKDLKRISAKLKASGMYWIQDIVPNHMGFHHHNSWLMDVLKNGEASAYRKYFDIISTDLSVEPIMVPFLGADLDEVIKKGELELVKKGIDSFLKYHDSIWPLKPGTDLTGSVKTIAEAQYYRLCSYKESNERINYRRFFTVNSLICVNMQNQQAFDDYHMLIKELVDEGVFQGLRIDHADGLYDPAGYLNRLRSLCGEQVYIVVEKILEPEETLPAGWPVQGTTGYDYLGLVNQLFTNEKAEKKFNNFYKELGKLNSAVQVQIRRKKKEFLLAYMQGELENLYQLLVSLIPVDQQDRIKGSLIFKDLIAEIMARCPVYRFYGKQKPLNDEEEGALQEIFESLQDIPEFAKPLKLLQSVLWTEDGRFYQRLMQFTGPLMAKGVEDTLMYTFNRFIGSNEVGDSPDVFGITTADFHEAITKRQQYWPLAMNASATHDTKRGEDARARLNVLTDLKNGWLNEVREWQELNKELKQQSMPDTNDEYFIYQTLIATWAREDPGTGNTYQDRLLAYIEKALRESKRNSNWEEPNEEYEDSTRNFIISILDKNMEFWVKFAAFYEKVSLLGRINSLSAMLLKHGCPGVPDTYQGTEFWDFSMVDPDNRRSVDYTIREQYLLEFEKTPVDLHTLWQQDTDGKLKLFLLQRMLQLRRSYPLVFAEGQYVPLEVKGKYNKEVIAFARRYQRDWLVFIAPVSITTVVDADPDQIRAVDWKDTQVILPHEAPAKFEELLGGIKGLTANGLLLKDLFKDLPLAVLHLQQPESKRGAGILMPVSSLPSAYGIGDFGLSAKAFLNFLSESGQKYWQLLPMNPLSVEETYSPYSATSVMAGNILLISPEELFNEGWLSQDDLYDHSRKTKRKISYAVAERLKDALLTKAFKKYREKAASGHVNNHAFEAFCAKEAYWLEDYALYKVLKALHFGEAWHDWPEEFRNREAEAIENIRKNQEGYITEVKWRQFVFFSQWAKLKQYAKTLNVSMIGDLPFYAALDSADVWANPKLFCLDKAGKIKGIAGVPPDYFNEEGQLWGMPVYNWDVMARHNYKWWIARIAKNLELYDLIRLDHFRAFSGYWEVPAGSTSAKNGSWKKGPGDSFFEVLKAHFDHLPLIAEDLGEITDDVFQLRDNFNLPGMKVLQFAFGEDIAASIHAPHNFVSDNCIVYTGTHDNNTTPGWYEQEAGHDTKKRIERYLGHKVSKANIHRQMIKLAYSTVAKIAIIPMQDVLGKSAKSRMNTPASVKGNWIWRLKPAELSQGLRKMLFEMVHLYGR